MVCDGVGLGAGGLGGGVTVVGFGVGLADVGPGAGVGWAPDELLDLCELEPLDLLEPGEADDPDAFPCFFAPWLDDGVAEGLGEALGVVVGGADEVVVDDAAE